MAITKYRPCSVDGCQGAVKARELCNAHWRRWKIHGDPLGGGTPKGDLLRFLQKLVAAPAQRECVIWPYATAGNGYGKIWFGGKDAFAHRAACELAHGPAPSAQHHASHDCGNGHLGCVNPAHLFWKTPRENNADKVRHGTVNSGSANGMAKLTPSQVHEIRNLRGSQTEHAIADRYGVSRAAISDIHSGRRWAST